MTIAVLEKKLNHWWVIQSLTHSELVLAIWQRKMLDPCMTATTIRMTCVTWPSLPPSYCATDQLWAKVKDNRELRTCICLWFSLGHSVPGCLVCLRPLGTLLLQTVLLTPHQHWHIWMRLSSHAVTTSSSHQAVTRASHPHLRMMTLTILSSTDATVLTLMSKMQVLLAVGVLHQALICFWSAM